MLFCSATRFTFPSLLSGTPARRFRHTTVIDRLKKPSRGGQNLSDRYQRLEKSLRGKEALSQERKNIDTLSPQRLAAGSSTLKKVQRFRGFELPTEPRPPDADECCMSGCAICVYDLHEESLDAYRDKLDTIRTSLSSLNIPESEWPAKIQSSKTGGTENRKNVIMNAFEEMERALKEKQSQAASGTPAGRLPKILSTQRSPKPQRSWREQMKEMCEGVRWVVYSNR